MHLGREVLSLRGDCGRFGGGGVVNCFFNFLGREFFVFAHRPHSSPAPLCSRTTEQPPTKVGGFARVAGDWKSTRFAPRAGDALTATCVDSAKPWPRICMAEANRLEAGGFNLVMEIKSSALP